MKTKIISSIVLIILFVPLLFIGGLPFGILLSIISVLSLHELLKIRSNSRDIPLFIELISYIIVAFFSLNKIYSSDAFYMIDYRLISILILIYLCPLVIINNKSKYNINDAMFMIGSTLFIGITFNLLVLFRNLDINYVIYILLISCFTDTFALFTGKYIGVHQLSPNLSPNKTIEGCVGGTIMGTFVASMFYICVFDTSISVFIIVFLTLILSLLGQFGDLVFSFIKREFNKKDFSNIIPGHGGILDRVDALIFITLGFLIMLSIL